MIKSDHHEYSTLDSVNLRFRAMRLDMPGIRFVNFLFTACERRMSFLSVCDPVDYCISNFSCFDGTKLSSDWYKSASMICLFLVFVRSRVNVNLSFLSAKIHIVCVQFFSVNVLSIAGMLCLTLLTSVPSQSLGVRLNKSILHDFSDFNFVCSMLYV